MTNNKASFFVEWQNDLMGAILNRIIPSNGDFPGAGDLGVIDYIDDVVGRSAELKHIFSDGLVQIQHDSQSGYQSAFTTLCDEDKDVLLNKIEFENPDFFQELIKYTYLAYYTDSKIIRLLGLEVRPPQPGGYDLDQMPDSRILEKVKKVKNKGPIYRIV